MPNNAPYPHGSCYRCEGPAALKVYCGGCQEQHAVCTKCILPTDSSVNDGRGGLLATLKDDFTVYANHDAIGAIILAEGLAMIEQTIHKMATLAMATKPLARA